MHGSLRTDRWRMIARTVVLLVFAIIVLDLWDESCYSLDVSQQDLAISAHESNPADACSGLCMPDCFCCSSVSPAITVAQALKPTSRSVPPSLPVEFLTEGISAVLDHIPITTV